MQFDALFQDTIRFSNVFKVQLGDSIAVTPEKNLNVAFRSSIVACFTLRIAKLEKHNRLVSNIDGAF